MKILFTSPDELEISGSYREMKEIKVNLCSLSEGFNTELFIDADSSASPSPYERALNSIQAFVSSGPTKISVDGNKVIIEGSSESFDGLSTFFSFNEGDPSGTHNHHEYIEGDIYIHPDSIPTVMAIEE